MKRISGLVALGAAAVALSAPATAATLTTAFDADNSNDGVMFDVSVLTGGVSLQSIGINAEAGTFDYAVYYRAGGIGTAVNTPDAWTLLGNFNALTTAGLGAVTLLDIADLDLAADSLYGFYVTDTQGAFSIAYTNSTGSVGDVLAADERLAIGVGYGVTWPFGEASSPRAFNGTLNYVAAVPEPASWAMMIAGFALVGTAMRRRRTRVVFA
ncbi:PEPxxWA-CTERM sorting domain-containing protein [Sphingomonas mollis]|nr:PEPxxWA-CTERM sorting domain-containing protein [Sphingomonas sp. BT553]